MAPTQRVTEDAALFLIFPRQPQLNRHSYLRPPTPRLHRRRHNIPECWQTCVTDNDCPQDSVCQAVNEKSVALIPNALKKTPVSNPTSTRSCICAYPPPLPLNLPLLLRQPPPTTNNSICSTTNQRSLAQAPSPLHPPNYRKRVAFGPL